MSVSLLGYAPSFFGHFSHNTIIIALSFSFLNVVKSCCLVLFSWRKTQKTKQTRRFSISFTSYLHNRSTSEHNSNRFGKLQHRATTFLFWPFLVIGHVTIILTSHWLDPDRQNHAYLVFLHLLVKRSETSFLGWTLTTISTIPQIFLIFLLFYSYY